MSSKDATFHAANDLIYVQQNPEPASPIVKLGDGHKEELRTLEDIFRKKTAPSSYFEGASQGGSPRETQRGEPGNISNEKCIPIKSSNRQRTSEGDYCRGIPIGIPTS